MSEPEVKAEEGTEEVPSAEEPTSEEPSSQGDDSAQPAILASQLMRNPEMLAALQDKLGSMVGHSSGYIQSLPKSVKRRIKALKKIQFEATKIEAEFYREVHRLECEYAAKYAPLFEKRSTMVMGDYEPNDEEADWPSDDEKDEDLAKGTDELASGDAKDEVEKKAKVEDKNDEKEEEKDETKGIPGFWLTIFKNVDMLSEMIQPNDEAILNHLQEIKVEFKEKDPMGFTLEFYFEANEHFDNKKLTKEYIMRSEPEEGDPFSFEGPEIIKCNGCKIDWKKGKNVTVKTVKKKQKHKASGTTRTIQKTVQNDSFFNFFSPPTPPEDEEMDEDTEALLAADFEIGHFIRERIVPRAVLYFTGEALENEDDYEDGEEEDGAEEGEYDEEGDPDYNPGRVKYTKEFQDRCAQLALGRTSACSSAPYDTRLFLRPNSGPGIRPSIPTGTNFRPQTAPGRSPNDRSVTMKPGERPSELTDEVFLASMHDLSKSQTIVSRRAHIGREKALVRESTDIVLPGTMESQGIEVRDKTKGKVMKPQPQPGYPRTQFMKPPARINREKTFLKTAKSPRDVIKARPSEKLLKDIAVLESLDEYSESDEEDDVEVEIGTKQNKVEVNRKQIRMIAHQPAGKGMAIERESRLIKEAKPAHHMKKFEAKSIMKKDESSAKTRTKSDVSDHAGKETSKHENPRMKGKVRQNDGKTEQRLDGGKSTGKPNNTKEAAFNILQKLTGKRQPGSHKPGQVPSVGKQQPVKKYKFDIPTGNAESAGPSEDKAKEAMGRTLGVKPGDVRRVPSQRRVDKTQKEYSERRAQDITNMYDQRSNKPVSAPVRGAMRQAKPDGDKELSTSLKHEPAQSKSMSQSADVRARDKLRASQVKTAGSKVDSRWQRQADKVPDSGQDLNNTLTDDKHKSYPNPKANIDNKQVSSSENQVHKRPENKSGTQKSRPVKAKEHPVIKKSDNANNVPSVSVSDKAGKGKGVRIQNAMISTDTEVSNAVILKDNSGETKSQRASSAASSVHEKLRESPYLRDNPLLQSGKLRRKPGASSAQGPGQSKDQS